MSKKADPRIKRTRKMFEDALLELMGRKEYKKITVQEIAHESGLNRATFYLHYYDKDQLLEQFLDGALDDLRESVRISDFEFSYESNYPHPSFVRLFEKMMKHSKFYKTMIADEKIPYFTEQVYKILEEFAEQALRYLKDDHVELKVHEELVVPYIASAYLGVIIWWLKNDMPYTPIYLSRQLTIMSTVGHFAENPFLDKG